MNNIYRFKKIDESMIDECVKVYTNTFSNEPWNDKFEDLLEVYDLFNNFLLNNYFIGYALTYEDKIVALSIGMKKPWIEGMEYYIDQFCVDYEYQQKGIGTYFIKLIEKDIKEKGMNAIILNTEKGFPSHRFYVKNGFVSLDDVVTLVK